MPFKAAKQACGNKRHCLQGEITYKMFWLPLHSESHQFSSSTCRSSGSLSEKPCWYIAQIDPLHLGSCECSNHTDALTEQPIFFTMQFQAGNLFALSFMLVFKITGSLKWKSGWINPNQINITQMLIQFFLFLLVLSKKCLYSGNEEAHYPGNTEEKALFIPYSWSSHGTQGKSSHFGDTSSIQ